jgi:cell fate (sporulation/competence/biofilm development) regulator YlbF (YheA/YmcA/DUF963 family)
MNRDGGVLMTAEIFEKAEILAAAIAKSSELSNLRSTEQAMFANEEAQQIIAEFQEEQQRLSELQEEGKELSEQDKQAIDAMEEKVENHPLIGAYLKAQDEFTQMLDSVNSILASAIAGESEHGDGCSCDSDGCGSGCSCGC